MSNQEDEKVTPVEDHAQVDREVAAYLRESCEKQERAIEAIEQSAYVTRHGRQELADPKRLALAVQLRAGHMAAFSGYIREIRKTDEAAVFWQVVVDEIVACESPACQHRIMQRLSDLNRDWEKRQRNDRAA
jgi:hypothetical protein